MASTATASTSSSAYNTIKSSLSTAESTVEKGLAFLSNKYVNNILLVLLVAYLPYAAPSLGQSMIGILNNYAVKFIYIFLIAYILSKNLSNKNSVKVATVSALVIVIGILILKNMGGSEHLDNVSNQESEQPKKKGFFERLFGLSNDDVKKTINLNLNYTEQGAKNKINNKVNQAKQYVNDKKLELVSPTSLPPVEVAKAVAKAQAVAVAQAEAHADAMEEIKAVSQPLSDENTCSSRAPSEVTGFDENNNSEYSDVNFSKSDLNNC